MSQAKRKPTLSKPSWTPDAGLFSLEVLKTTKGLEVAAVHLQKAIGTSRDSTLVGVHSAIAYLLTLDPCVFALLFSCKRNRTASIF